MDGSDPGAGRRIVIVGNGMAGIRLVEELLQAGCPGRSITVLGAEQGGAYNRIMLTPLLAGERDKDAVITHPPSWYVEREVTLVGGAAVTAIDRAARIVSTASGQSYPYDRLVLATGSLPIMLPLPGRELAGLRTYRDMADTEALTEAAARGGHAIVIGGGLLGLEAANGLARRGMSVTVVHLLGTLMERQLDEEAGTMLRRSLEARGIAFHMPAVTSELLGTDRIEAVTFKDGTTLPADLVVMAVGIRPEVTLARATGLACNRGVLVDDAMVTDDPAILAVGECVEHRGVCYGLVAPLYDQAKVAAQGVMGGSPAYAGSVTATGLKVTGVDLFSAGDFALKPGRHPIVLRDRLHDGYRKLVLEEDRLVGAVLVGDVSDGPWYAQLIREGQPLGSLRADLIFGRAYAEAA